jgi:hypothetical protein
MPSPGATRAAANLKFELKNFYENVNRMRDATVEECRKCLVQGAAAYASVAQRHTPPALGQQDIPSTFYQTLEMDRVLEKNERTNGMRVIYYLRECVRNPKTRRLKHMFGKLLREGYEYVVVIHSKSRKTKGYWTYYKPCKTIDQARAYAKEDWRGLMRVSWWLGFIDKIASGRMPPVFNRYVQRRPRITSKRLGEVNFLTDDMAIEIINHVIPDNAGFLPGLDLTSSVASVKSMNKYMTEYFENQKVAL